MVKHNSGNFSLVGPFAYKLTVLAFASFSLQLFVLSIYVISHYAQIATALHTSTFSRGDLWLCTFTFPNSQTLSNFVFQTWILQGMVRFCCQIMIIFQILSSTHKSTLNPRDALALSFLISWQSYSLNTPPNNCSCMYGIFNPWYL